MARRASAELEQVNGDGPSRSRRVAGGLTAPSAILAAILLVLAAVLGFWLDIYYGTAPRFGAGVPASGPITFLFLLTAACSVRFVQRRLRLGRRQLLSIYGIVLVALSPDRIPCGLHLGQAADGRGGIGNRGPGHTPAFLTLTLRRPCANLPPTASPVRYRRQGAPWSGEGAAGRHAVLMGDRAASQRAL